MRFLCHILLMLLGLSCVSSLGIWVLIDPRTQSLLGAKSWSDDHSSELSRELVLNLEWLLTETKINLSQVTEIYGTSGPGAFTGLRITGAFLTGLSLALNVPFYGIPTQNLIQPSGHFWIPLQHQKVKKWKLEKAIEEGVEFLKISSQETGVIGVPGEKDLVLGLENRPLWPTVEEFSSAIALSFKNKDQHRFVISYGSDPKVGTRPGAPSARPK